MQVFKIKPISVDLVRHPQVGDFGFVAGYYNAKMADYNELELRGTPAFNSDGDEYVNGIIEEWVTDDGAHHMRYAHGVGVVTEAPEITDDNYLDIMNKFVTVQILEDPAEIAAALATLEREAAEQEAARANLKPQPLEYTADGELIYW